MISTAPSNVPGAGGYSRAVALEIEGFAILVEADRDHIFLEGVGPVRNVSTTLTRSEGRELALALIEASQMMEEM
jgi:hypothetical protein